MGEQVFSSHFGAEYRVVHLKPPCRSFKVVEKRFCDFCFIIVHSRWSRLYSHEVVPPLISSHAVQKNGKMERESNFRFFIVALGILTYIHINLTHTLSFATAGTGEISSDLYGLSGCDILNLTFCRLDFHQLLIKIS